jgi:hypothetical protein
MKNIIPLIDMFYEFTLQIMKKDGSLYHLECKFYFTINCCNSFHSFGSNGGIVSIVSKVCYEHVFKIGKIVSRYWDKFHPIHMFMDSILQ